MLTVISPSKNLDFKTQFPGRRKSAPQFLSEAAELMDSLKKLEPGDISSLMNVSRDLGELNAERFRSWSTDSKGARQAILAFKGEVYWGLEAWNFSARELTSAQRRLRILSGLYGLLKPLDTIHPYRLEMGLSFETPRASSISSFWDSKLTDAVNADLAKQSKPLLLNLASKEYSAVLHEDRLNYPVLTCEFLNKTKSGDYRFMQAYGKRARGFLARYVIQNKIETRKGIREFALENYRYCPERSSASRYIFLRDRVPPR